MKHEVIEHRAFPAWHFAMMNDDARNSAIAAAIADIDMVGKTVFEIGSGAGLVAMMFAEAGAAHVVTCEMDPQLAGIARRAVHENGLDDRITVLNMSSTDAIDRGLVNFVPDVLFTETIDCGLVGEGYARVAADVQRVAGPNTIVLPTQLVQLGYLVECREIWRLNRVETCRELSFRAIDAFSTGTYFPVRASTFRSRSLSPVLRLRSLDYFAPPTSPTDVAIETYATGECHGLVTYFEARFGRHVVTNDLRDASHWHQAFHPLPERLSIEAGRTYRGRLNLSGRFELGGLS